MKILEIAGKAVAILAFLFGVFTYAVNIKRDHDKDRYAAADNFIKEYTSSGIRDKEDEFDLKLLYYTRYVDINDENAFPDSAFRPVADELLFDYVEGREPDQQNRDPFLPKIFDIIDYYERANYCIQQGICNAAMLESFLCPRLANFYRKSERILKYYWDFAHAEGENDEFLAFHGRCAEKT